MSTDSPKVKMLNTEQKQQEKSNKQEINTVAITDEKGKKIILKKPNVLAQYHLVEMIGDSAKNQVYMAMVMPLVYVESVDGMIMNVTKKSELEALILRLGDEGVSAVMTGVQENFMSKSAEDEKEKLKK